MEFNFTGNLEVQISKQGIVDHVSGVAKSDLLATFREFYLFPAPGDAGGGVQPGVNDVLVPAMDDISTIWAFNVHVRYWWMM